MNDSSNRFWIKIVNRCCHLRRRVGITMLACFFRNRLPAVVKRGECRSNLTTVAEHSESIKPDKSFYRRPLPETCVGFSSKRGRSLLAQALQENSLKSYFLLAVSEHVSLRKSCRLLDPLTYTVSKFCRKIIWHNLNRLSVGSGVLQCVSMLLAWILGGYVFAVGSQCCSFHQIL